MITDLKVTDIGGKWFASWDRDGRHFDSGELYGYDHKKTYVQLKILLEDDHGIILPSELAIKSHMTEKFSNKKVYKVPDNLVKERKMPAVNRDTLQKGYLR